MAVDLAEGSQDVVVGRPASTVQISRVSSMMTAIKTGLVMDRHFERFAAGFLMVFMLLLLLNPRVFTSTPAFQQMDDWAAQWVWALVDGGVGMAQGVILFTTNQRRIRKWMLIGTGATCLFITALFWMGNPNGSGWISVGWIATCCFWAAWLLR